MTEPAARPDRATPGSNAPEFSVSDLAGAIKRALEDGFGHVRLRGEVSGYRGPHASGHCYFALKDDRAKIEAVIWRGVFGKLKFKPEEGLEVVVTGKISSFPGSSKYQIVVEALEPAGAGALMAQLEQRKRKLAAEGLFEEGRKRRLPFLPRVVGIVTSPTGAVIRDMLHGFAERFPTHVIVWPVRVQGETSAAEVTAAVRGFNALPPGGRLPRPDVLIVARGGGSLEDLWGFNDEALVRAVAASELPVISAVGHETDWTLIDLVADARAPTPTKAAEWAVPKRSDLIEQTSDRGARLRVSLRRALEGHRAALRAAARGLPSPQDLIALPRQRFDSVDRRLGRALLANTRAHAMRHARVSSRLQLRLLGVRIERSARRLAETHERTRAAMTRITGDRRRRFERVGGRLRIETLANRIDAKARALESQAKLLASLSYQSVLARGFALVRDADGAMVRSAARVAAADVLSIEFRDGRVGVVAQGGGEGPLSDGPRSAMAEPGVRVPKRRRGSGQGNLF
ncbi:MAG: exodeoxyribonuclease VII large subunit [Hyphomicrobium sp.]